MGEVLRRFMLPMVPRTKKNSMEIRRRRDGSQFVSPSGEYQIWERSAAEYLEALNWWREPLSGPVNLSEHFYMPNARRVDISNLTEAIDDVLVRAGVIADDCVRVVAGHEGSYVAIDRNNPRVEIIISEAESWQVFGEVKK